MNTSSASWVRYFRENLQELRINWQQPVSLSPAERKTITKSLQAWQLGETSEGKHLLTAARIYSDKINDPLFTSAIELFIREEQKHGANLGRYLDMAGERRISTNWGDSVFRKIRGFNRNMECWTATVIVVETFAQLYYRALSESTDCKLLKEICSDILTDEVQHIRFQLQRLQEILAKKSFLNARLSVLIYRILFEGTLLAVWAGHRKVFKASGMDFIQYSYHASRKFRHIENQLLRSIYQKRSVSLTPVLSGI